MRILACSLAGLVGTLSTEGQAPVRPAVEPQTQVDAATEFLKLLVSWGRRRRVIYVLGVRRGAEFADFSCRSAGRRNPLSQRN